MTAIWSSLGPSQVTGILNYLPCGGRIDGIDISPDFDGAGNPAMYLAMPGGGVWRSSDFTGASPTWLPLTDHLPGIADVDRVGLNVVSTVSVDPTNPRTIYARNGAGASLLKSSDAGASWIVIGTNAFGVAGDIWRVLADPTGAVSVAFGSGGFWQSRNGGATWVNAASAALDGVEFHDAVYLVDANGTTTIFVGVVDRQGQQRSGIWSLVNGQWTQMAMTLQNLRSQTFTPDVINRITLSANAAAGVCASLSQVDDGIQKIGLLNVFTPANGVWQPRWFSQTDWFNTQRGYVQGTCLASDGRIYAGGIGLAQSAGGTSFVPIGLDAQGTAIHVDEHVVIEYQGQIYVGTDGGLFRCTPRPGAAGIDKWQSLNTPSLTNFLATGATVDPFHSAVALVGSQDNGIARRSQSGQWAYSDFSNEREVVRFDPHSADQGKYAYSGDPNNGFFWSQDNGATFSGFGPPGATAPDPPPPFAFHPKDNAKLLIGWSDVYETPDRGTTWNKKVGLQAAPTAVAYEGDHAVYVGFNGQLWQSFNDGNNWAVDPFTFRSTIVAICGDPTNPGAVYVATSYRVFRRFTSTTGWEDITGNLALQVNTMRLKGNGAGKDPWLFVATGAGVFIASTLRTYATWWTRFGSGLPDANVSELELHPDTGLLVAATWGRGAWSTLVGSEAPGVWIVAKRDDCGVFAVEGGTATVRAHTTELNPPLVFKWLVTNSAPVGPDNGVSFTFDSPPLGVTAVVSVVVTDSDGAVATASFDVVSISAQSASFQYFICNLRKTEGLYNPFWWIETRGGLVPPGPPDPWVRQVAVAVALAAASQTATPELRQRILAIASEQLDAASAGLHRQIGVEQ
jgi:hypothetical protein